MGLSAIDTRSEVIMPAYTCPSVAAAAIKAGLKPVLCELRRDNFFMDRTRLEACIGEETLAVIAVHLFGIPEDMGELRGLTVDGGIYLIAVSYTHLTLPTN